MTSTFDIGLISLTCVETFVWEDANGDGIQQDVKRASGGIGGIVVNLVEASGARELIASATSNDEGLATFQRVPMNKNVRLQITPSNDYRFAPRGRGDDVTRDSDAIPNGANQGFTASFRPSEDGNSDLDFGLIPSNGGRLTQLEDPTSVHIDQLEIPDEDMLIYPNPAVRKVSIAFELSEESDGLIGIFDLSGQAVQKVNAKTLPAGRNRITLDVSQLPVGTYLVRMEMGNRLLTKRLLIQK